MKENNNREILEYRIDRVTEFGEYVAIVRIDMLSRKGRIYLYEGEPTITGVWGLVKVQNDHIREASISPTTDLNYAITKMIVDWELPLYQQAKAEAEDSYLYIDHEAEIKKRRTQAQQEEAEAQQEQERVITYTEYGSSEVHELPRKGVHPNSLANLKQYQNKKRFG